MNFFEKAIDQLNLDDVRELLSTINNESHRVDFKAIISMEEKQKYEFLRDVVSFLNIGEKSCIIYGISDDKAIRGIIRTPDMNEDRWQNHLINWLKEKIIPDISDYVHIQPITIDDKRFLIIVQTDAPSTRIFGIEHRKEKYHEKEVDLYEFWTRMSGNKRQISFHELIERKNLILANSTPHTDKEKLLQQIIELFDTIFAKKAIFDFGLDRDQIIFRLKYLQNNESNLQNWFNINIHHTQETQTPSIIDNYDTNGSFFGSSIKEIFEFNYIPLDQELNRFNITITIWNNTLISGEIKKNKILGEKYLVFDFLLQFYEILISNIEKFFKITPENNKLYQQYQEVIDNITKGFRQGADFSELLLDISYNEKLTQMFQQRDMYIEILHSENRFLLLLKDQQREIRVEPKLLFISLKDNTPRMDEKEWIKEMNKRSSIERELKQNNPNQYWNEKMNIFLKINEMYHEFLIHSKPEFFYSKYKQILQWIRSKYLEIFTEKDWSKIDTLYEWQLGIQKIFPRKILLDSTQIQFNQYFFYYGIGKNRYEIHIDTPDKISISLDHAEFPQNLDKISKIIKSGFDSCHDLTLFSIPDDIFYINPLL